MAESEQDQSRCGAATLVSAIGFQQPRHRPGPLDKSLSAPSVTWLLPVKNGERYVEETLASILTQTHGRSEVLAWDNGSTDGTVTILSQWIPARLPGRIVKDRPMGLGACLAAMVKTAQTEFCARIDADDINHPERLERQVKFLIQHPDVVACGTQMIRIDEAGRETGGYFRRPLRHGNLTAVSITQCPLNHPTVMFRKDAVLKAGNYRDVKPLEDWDLWTRLALRGRLANLHEDLVRYRIHPRSVSSGAGNLNEQITEMLAGVAPDLYGLSAHEFHSLRNHEGRRSKAALILKAARHLRSEFRVTALASPWFRLACAAWIHASDWPARGLITMARLLSPFELADEQPL